MNELEDILQLPPAEFDSRWRQIDAVVSSLPTFQDQMKAWERILNHMAPHSVSKGMPYFRLGVLHLLTDPEETKAISFLERAYHEDEQYGPPVGLVAHRMGAYRLLALVKGFL